MTFPFYVCVVFTKLVQKFDVVVTPSAMVMLLKLGTLAATPILLKATDIVNVPDDGYATDTLRGIGAAPFSDKRS